MKAVIQRVDRARVLIEDVTYASIETGLLILLGIETTDTQEDIQWLSKKISHLRIFDDSDGVMNLSLKQIDANALIVSQFTLHASTKKGNRPSYIKAARPETAIPLYELFIKQMEQELGKKVATGQFGAHMLLDFVNNGPVTIIIDSKNRQ